MVKDSNSQPSLNFVYIPIFKFQLMVPFVNLLSIFVLYFNRKNGNDGVLIYL